MVVAGKSGTGKSTLINNFLSLDKNKAAESRLQPTSVTKEVKRYDGKVNGVPIRAVDMPGLHARRHSEDTESEVIAALCHFTGGNADILIYCVSLTQRLDSIDERNIATLNKAFGKKIWNNAIFVLTHADAVLEDEDNKSNFDELVEGFTRELQEILTECEVDSRVRPFSSNSSHTSNVGAQGEDMKTDTSDMTTQKELRNETSGSESEAKISAETTAVPCMGTQPSSSDPGPQSEVAPESKVAKECEQDGETTSVPAKAPDTEESKKLQIEIVAIPTGKKPTRPPGWRDSLLTQVITISVSYTHLTLPTIYSV